MRDLDHSPPTYPPLPYHGTRLITFISASIVGGILAYFCVQLHHDSFRIPWAFFIVLFSIIFTLFILLTTFLLHSCGRLHPLLSAITNILVLLVQIIAFAILTYNLYGTLGHSCSASNWANAEGRSVCNTYKLMYAFMIFGLLSKIAEIVIDFRTRRAIKNASYARVGEGGSADLKDGVLLQPYNNPSNYAYNGSQVPSPDHSRGGSPIRTGGGYDQNREDIMYGLTGYGDGTQRGYDGESRSRPAYRRHTSSVSNMPVPGFGHNTGYSPYRDQGRSGEEYFYDERRY